MREKDYRKLYECEFPIMKRLLTEKDVFQARLYNRPIMLYTSNATQEQKADCMETLWRTGVYRPLGLHELSKYSCNATTTHHVNEKCKSTGNLHDWLQIKKGAMFLIPEKEWKKRYDDWFLKINK